MILAACASEPADSPDGSAAGGQAGAAAGGAGGDASGGSTANCGGAPSYAEEHDSVLIDSVRANVVDQDGAPAAGLEVQVCGTDICVIGSTDDGGAAAVAVGVGVKKPAFKYGIGLDFARLGFLLGSAADQELGSVTAVRLPGFTEGAALAPGATATSNGVTLSLVEGGSVVHDTLVYATPAEQTFRAASIPLDGALFGEGTPFEAAFALAPVETKFCPPAGLSLPNDAAWPANSGVEFFALGLDTLERWARYAEWTKVGDGGVTSDGSRIELAGEGISILFTAIAVRRSP